MFDLLPEDQDAWGTPGSPPRIWTILAVVSKLFLLIVLVVIALLLPPWVGIPLSAAVAAVTVRSILQLAPDRWWARTARWERLRLSRPRGNARWWVAGCTVYVVATLATSVVEASLFGPVGDGGLVDRAMKLPGRIVVLVVFAGLLFPFVEEAVFRGWLTRVIEAWKGRRAALWMTAIVFALAHGQPTLLGGLVLSGLAFSAAVGATGSLWASVTMHMVLNTLAVVSSPFIPEESITRLLAHGATLPVALLSAALGWAAFFWILRHVAGNTTEESTTANPVIAAPDPLTATGQP